MFNLELIQDSGLRAYRACLSPCAENANWLLSAIKTPATRRVYGVPAVNG